MTVTVLTRATATALTTVAHARGDLGLPSGSPSDEQLARFIDQTSADAARFCRRTFGRQTVRERFEIGYGSIDDVTRGLLLDCGPVVQVNSVTIDGVLQAVGAYETADRYLFRLQDGARRCWYGRVILVEYIAGWFLPGESGTAPTGIEPLPADIEAAVIQLVGVRISASGRDAMVKSEDVEGVGSTSWYVQGAGASLPHPEAEATLQQYRRVMLA